MLHDRTKKILIIASEFPPGPGGIGNHAYNLALHLAKNDFAVTVLADIDSNAKNCVDTPVPQNHFRLLPVFRSNFAVSAYINRIRKAIKYSGENDLVIVSGKFPVWVVTAIKRFYPTKKIIAVVHGSELLLSKKWQRYLLTKGLAACNSIIAVSNFTKSLLPLAVLQKMQCAVIPNGINADEFASAQIDEIRIPDVERLQLITVGSVTERKGQENVINALPEILKKFPGATYHIAGKPVLRKKLDQIIDQKNLRKHVTFYGSLNRKALIHVLDTADIKLLLSNNIPGDAEGFGIAILEANALGIPAIGSKNTGIEDAIKKDETGVLVNPKNIFEIVAAIEKIITDYARFSSSAKQWASRHEWQKIVNQYIEEIEKTF